MTNDVGLLSSAPRLTCHSSLITCHCFMSTTLETPSLANQPSKQLERTSKALTIALAGNPNAGKTTLFNTLTGLRQKVANYPGVTVERKEGTWLVSRGAPPARLIDLPGLYSL